MFVNNIQSDHGAITKRSQSDYETKKVYRKAGPFHVEFHGLQACLRNNKSKANIKSMLVSHAFVDLWRTIEEDKSFNKALFDLLDESEQDFMKHCLIKCKITSREFESAYNQLLDGLVTRLKMLEGAKNIGNDNSSIKTEMKSILDKLYEKGVFSPSYYSQFKRLMNL
jgi:predicted transcriptional regulator YheO